MTSYTSFVINCVALVIFAAVVRFHRARTKISEDGAIYGEILIRG